MIRPATTADVAGVRACVDAAYAPLVERLGQRPAAMRANYDALIGAGEMHVAEKDGEITAAMALHSDGEVLHVGNLAVSPAVQRSGIGSAMVGYAEEVARRSGLSELRLFTNEAMHESIAFCDARGFVEAGRRIDDGFRRVFFSRPVPVVAAGECLACDLTFGRRELPGGLVHRRGGWRVEHTVGPLGLGTLIVKPVRHVTAVGELEPAEASDMGRVICDAARVVDRLVEPEQVYVSLWSHEGGRRGHIHFVVQPARRGDVDELGLGPMLQAGKFAKGEVPDPADVAAFCEEARAAFAR